MSITLSMSSNSITGKIGPNISSSIILFSKFIPSIIVGSIYKLFISVFPPETIFPSFKYPSNLLKCLSFIILG